MKNRSYFLLFSTSVYSSLHLIPHKSQSTPGCAGHSLYNCIIIFVAHPWVPESKASEFWPITSQKSLYCSPRLISWLCASTVCERILWENTLSYKMKYMQLSLSLKSRGPDKILRVISSLRWPISDVIHLIHVYGLLRLQLACTCVWKRHLEFKYPLIVLLISHTNFEKAATEINECWWLLTSKNTVKQCPITKVTKAPLRTLWV